jgi:hypothetical protein
MKKSVFPLLVTSILRQREYSAPFTPTKAPMPLFPEFDAKHPKPPSKPRFRYQKRKFFLQKPYLSRRNVLYSMMMKRILTDKLLAWKNRRARKPLIINGGSGSAGEALFA